MIWENLSQNFFKLSFENQNLNLDFSSNQISFVTYILIYGLKLLCFLSKMQFRQEYELFCNFLTLSTLIFFSKNAIQLNINIKHATFIIVSNLTNILIENVQKWFNS